MQTGKVVDYFNEVEDIVLRLNYDKDTSMVMDQVIGGLKEHIRIKFIGRTWFAFDDMKVEIIPYDEAHWQIKKPPPREKTKNTITSRYDKSFNKCDRYLYFKNSEHRATIPPQGGIPVLR
jgi:hypothetical protein